MKSPAVIQSDVVDIALENPVVQQVAHYAEDLLKNRLPSGMLYHSFEHTSEVAEAGQRIGRRSGLDDEQMEILLIAAWMHDTGYTVTYQGHEEEGARMASDFLRSIAYPEEKIRQVTDAIMATKVPQSPHTPIEEVLCDADLIHLAHKDFFDKGRLLRLEWEHVRTITYSDFDWLRFNLDFLEKHSFHTSYVRSKFEEQRQKNVKRLRKRIRKMLAEDNADETEPTAISATTADNGTEQQEQSTNNPGVKKVKKPGRGIETMFRTTSRNHIDFSSIADQKANIMITTNALVISIVVSLLGQTMGTDSYLLIPTLILLTVCVTTIIFATLSTRPSISSGTFTTDDIHQRKVNLLFFGNFYKVSLDDYEQGVREMMSDQEYLYGSMIKDIYVLGKVLGKKYRYLRICYSIFMYGLAISVLSFAIAFILAGR